MPDAQHTKRSLPTLATFPLQMRQAPRWLLWKGNKVPHYANGRPRGSYGGGLDTPEDLAHLVDAKTAYNKLKTTTGYTGLGFALGEGWYGFDLDHVIDPASRLILPWAENLLTFCVVAGMYAELSPSRTGLHMIGWWHECNFRNGRQTEHVEAYHSGRYFTMTGDACMSGARPRKVVVQPLPALALLPALRATGAPPTLALVPSAPQPPQNGSGDAQAGGVGTGWLAARADALEALAALSADCSREQWRNVGMALHHASRGHPEGLAIWEAWSAAAAGAVNDAGEPRYVPGHCAKNWASFGKSDAAPLTLGTLLHMAQEARRAREQGEVPAEVAKPRQLAGGMADSFSMSELFAADLPATRWLAADLIAPGLTLLAAPPKAGKSYLALQMAQCVAAGKPFLDRETNASPVCYFDLEQWPTLIKPRALAIAKGHAIPAGIPLRFRMSMGVSEAAVAQMTEEIDRGVKLIVVDLFARVRDELAEDAKKNAYARDYAAISKLADFSLGHPDVAIVVIHHANKGRHDEWQAKISGSYGLTGGSHANVYLSRPDLRGMGDEDRDHAMDYRVLHAQGKLVEEQEFVIEKMPAGGGWRCSKVRPWEISTTLLQARLLVALAPRYPAYTSAKELAELVGRPFTAVRQLLVRMAQGGKVDSEGQGGSGYRVRR